MRYMLNSKGPQCIRPLICRSGYYHMGLSADSQAKSAFVIGGPHTAKFEFKVCPFGLGTSTSLLPKNGE